MLKTVSAIVVVVLVVVVAFVGLSILLAARQIDHSLRTQFAPGPAKADGCVEHGAYLPAVDGLPAPPKGWLYLLLDVVVFPPGGPVVGGDGPTPAAFRRSQFTAWSDSYGALEAARAPAGTGLPIAGTVEEPLRGQVAFLVPDRDRFVTVRVEDSPPERGDGGRQDRSWTVAGPAGGEPVLPPVDAYCPPRPDQSSATPVPGDRGTPPAFSGAAERGRRALAGAALANAGAPGYRRGGAAAGRLA